MTNVIDRTLHLTSPGTLVTREKLGLQVKVAKDSVGASRVSLTPDDPAAWRFIQIPIEELESVCVFDPTISFSPGAQELCLERGVALNFLREHGRSLARFTGVADQSGGVRRAQLRAADNPANSADLARTFVAGRLENSRNQLHRAFQEAGDSGERRRLSAAIEQLTHQAHDLARMTPKVLASPGVLPALRGLETAASDTYFGVFNSLLKPTQEQFIFTARFRHSPPDRVNCLLNFVYNMVLQDCAAAVTAAGLDPEVGFLHTERPNRPALALDLMEEFRPWLADRLVINLVQEKKMLAEHFKQTKDGSVALSEAGGEVVTAAYHARQEDSLVHPDLVKEFQIGQLPVVQARLLARFFRGDIAEYRALVLV